MDFIKRTEIIDDNFRAYHTGLIGTQVKAEEYEIAYGQFYDYRICPYHGKFILLKSFKDWEKDTSWVVKTETIEEAKEAAEFFDVHGYLGGKFWRLGDEALIKYGRYGATTAKATIIAKEKIGDIFKFTMKINYDGTITTVEMQ